MTTYKLKFVEEALKEYQALDNGVKAQFKKKLQEILVNPHRPANQVSGMASAYKIKLKKSGFRLVYIVHDDAIVVQVISVGKRERLAVYRKAMSRMLDRS